MKLLKVPYVQQYNINACGAAVLEMVYKYYGIKNISQKKLMHKYQELEPHGSGNYRMTTDVLVSDAKEKGFNSGWVRANFGNTQDSIALLKMLVENVEMPVIVCQKYTDEQPLIGHFRVVYGVDDEKIFLHDPSKETGGPDIQWSVDKFMDFWQPTGGNVTGGILCFISK